MSFLSALNCQNYGRPPIWLMRQAGRYLPEYRKLKEGKRLFDLFHDPEMIVNITKLPVDLLNVDAAILFSDILTVLDSLHVRYDFLEGVGPVIADDEPSRIMPADESYKSVLQAIRLLKKELTVPLIGFAGAPFTIACYLIEKKTSRDQKKAKEMLFSNPKGFQELIDLLTEATIQYLKAQEDAGVDAIQLFDSWASSLGIEEFRQYCLKPIKKILNTLKVPTIIFCRGSSFFAEEIAQMSPQAISIDWMGDLIEIRKKIPQTIAIQGNLDPMALYASTYEIKKKVDRLLNDMRGDHGYIFNLGHGLLPDIPVDHVKFLVDYVRSFA